MHAQSTAGVQCSVLLVDYQHHSISVVADVSWIEQCLALKRGIPILSFPGSQWWDGTEGMLTLPDTAVCAHAKA